MGYHRAGFDVIGLDIEHHPDYPFDQFNMDAMALLANVEKLDYFDVIAASPPCPRYSTATPQAARDKHPDLVEPVRTFLEAWGGLYVIENVPGAPLRDPLMLCGSMFDLGVRRHRLFESNVAIEQPACDHKSQGAIFGVYGQHADRPGGWKRPDGTSRGLKATSVEHARELLGIDWMSEWSDLADSIPPAYTEHVGLQLMEHLLERAA